MTLDLFARYQELQRYVGWTDADCDRILDAAPLIEPHLPRLVNEFYAEVEQHAGARKVITGGDEQIARLKGSLLNWLRQLLSGRYDADYVAARWRVGQRHVEIGLDQVFTNAALARLRRGMNEILGNALQSDGARMHRATTALGMVIDLDLAIIEDAYQSEYIARASRMERLALIGKVAGGVAHELRNPLNVVKTSVYFLLHARNATPEKIREHLGRIERQVDVADGVISTLSDFARMPTPERRPVVVRDSIEEAIVTTQLPSGIETRLEIGDPTLAALVDPKQLQIILGNLIRNARDAMPGGGRISFRSRVVGRQLELLVEDTGTGIPPGDLQRIMEPFFSTKARGIGLGLALSRTIVERNNGALHAASEPGRGSTFTVRLELADGTDHAGA